MFDLGIEEFIVLFLLIIIFWFLCRDEIKTTENENKIVNLPVKIIKIENEDNIDLIEDDKHNVHNQTLIKIINQTIEKMKKDENKDKSKDKDKEDIDIDIYKEIIDLFSNYDLTRIKYILKEIEKASTSTESDNSELEINDREVLHLVLKRMKDKRNKDNYDVLVHNLYLSLNEFIEDVDSGDIICKTGRITRYIQIFEHCDFDEELVCLKPLWIFKDEISTIIREYVDKCIEQNEMFRKLYFIDNIMELNNKYTKRYLKYVNQIQKTLNKKIKNVYSQFLEEEKIKKISDDIYKEIFSLNSI